MSTTADSPPGRSAKTKAVLGALSLLVIGGVLGVALDRHVLLNDDAGAAADIHNPAAAAFHEAALASLEERLDLHPAQRRQIDSIMASRHHVLRQTWETLHVQLGAAVDSVHRDVEAVLTPEQRREFREWLRELEAGR